MFYRCLSQVANQLRKKGTHMSIIEMRDVVKKYDNGTTALRGVSVSVQPGEFAYIVGPSREQGSQPSYVLYIVK